MWQFAMRITYSFETECWSGAFFPYRFFPVQKIVKFNSGDLTTTRAVKRSWTTSKGMYIYIYMRLK